ncbi:hypothetical protein ACOCEA_13685 [Maribacter sp. CXY002]|uniref:hypothetical protein n=1 Tax=Maribacter luteocoastalis TaxID=3407671 RepID=UPI003B6844FB
MKTTYFIIILCGLIFFIWTILSIWAQLSNAYILRYNFFGFIPYCRFFSPNPVSTDLKIYYRTAKDEMPELDYAIWKPLRQVKNNKYSFIWSPEKKNQKTLNTLVRNLLIQKKRHKNIEFSLPYLTLLNIIQTNLASNQNGDLIQFLITRHKGYESDNREKLFISKIHCIDAFL